MYFKCIANWIFKIHFQMGNKYTESFSDAFKMYLEIFPRQAVYEVKSVLTIFRICKGYFSRHLPALYIIRPAHAMQLVSYDSFVLLC